MMQKRPTAIFSSTMVMLSTLRFSRASVPHAFFRASSASIAGSTWTGCTHTASTTSISSKHCSSVPSALLFRLRGGSSHETTRDALSKSSARECSSSSVDGNQKYVTLAEPAPGSPFHYAFPVHSLEEAKHFYGTVLGCEEGRSSEKWQDYSLHGHQIVCHWVGDDYRCVDYYNPVDGDEVPVPHAGLALTVTEFHALAERVKEAGVKFIIQPHLRFEGMPGEQWTMFFKDPSGNNLEFKAMTKVENLFAKYNVVD